MTQPTFGNGAQTERCALGRRLPPNNWHLNPNGHLVVATELRRLLASLKVNGA